MAGINDWEDVPVASIDDWDDVTDQEPEEVSKLESLARGGAQGLSFGFADEITGGLESMLTDKSYEQARDESRAAYSDAKEANPKTFLAGELTGAVAPAVAATLATGGAAAPTVAGSVAKTLAPTTLKGAAKLGAVDALGHSEADLTKGEVGEAASDAAKGGVLGGMAGAVGKGIQAVGDNLLPALKSIWTKEGREAVNFGANAVKKAGLDDGLDKADDIIEFGLKPNAALKDAGETIVGGNSEAMLKKAQMVKDASGSDVGGILTQLDEAGVPGPDKVAMWENLTKLQERIAKDTPNLGADVVKQYDKAINDILALPERPTFAQVQSIKQTIGDIAYKHGNPLESKGALQDAYTIVNKAMEDAVDAGSNALKKPELGQAYKAGKKAYDMSLRLIESLESKVAKDSSQKLIGAGDFMTFGLGATAGSAIGMPFAGGTAALATKKAYESRGHQAISKGAYTLEQKLEKIITANPAILGKYLPMIRQAIQRGQLAATNYVLQQRDPEYAELLKKISDEKAE